MAAGTATFPPFDPSTFGSQVFWLVITFGRLYILMRRVAVPQIGGILEDARATASPATWRRPAG